MHKEGWCQRTKKNFRENFYFANIFKLQVGMSLQKQKEDFLKKGTFFENF